MTTGLFEKKSHGLLSRTPDWVRGVLGSVLVILLGRVAMTYGEADAVQADEGTVITATQGEYAGMTLAELSKYHAELELQKTLLRDELIVSTNGIKAQIANVDQKMQELQKSIDWVKCQYEGFKTTDFCQGLEG